MLFLVEWGILILPCAFHALFIVERGILILPCAFKESVMIFMDLQRLVNTLHDPYNSYESTATGTLRWTGSVMYANDLVMNGRVDNDLWIHYSIRTTCMNGQVSFTSQYSRQYWTFLRYFGKSKVYTVTFGIEQTLQMHIPCRKYIIMWVDGHNPTYVLSKNILVTKSKQKTYKKNKLADTKEPNLKSGKQLKGWSRPRVTNF